MTTSHKSYRRWRNQPKSEDGGITGYYDLNVSYLGYLEEKAPRFMFLDCGAPLDSIEFLKASQKDPNVFSWDEAMSQGPEEVKKWRLATWKEVHELEKKGTWLEVPESKATVCVIPGCWVFKIKTAPDGTPMKYKARWVLRGDLQDI